MLYLPEISKSELQLTENPQNYKNFVFRIHTEYRYIIHDLLILNMTVTIDSGGLYIVMFGFVNFIFG